MIHVGFHALTIVVHVILFTYYLPFSEHHLQLVKIILTHLRLCIVPAEITEPPKISGGQNHKYDSR
jgi:hypothetical protein